MRAGVCMCGYMLVVDTATAWRVGRIYADLWIVAAQLAGPGRAGQNTRARAQLKKRRERYIWPRMHGSTMDLANSLAFVLVLQAREKGNRRERSCRIRHKRSIYICTSSSQSLPCMHACKRTKYYSSITWTRCTRARTARVRADI